MPIVLKDYTFTETLSSITVTIPVPRTSKADIHSTPLYLKINSPPYLFHLDFAHPVDVASGKSTIHPHRIVVSLDKTNPELWNDVAFINTGGREAIVERRKEGDSLLLKYHELERQKNKEEKVERDRELVKKQITHERAEREAIEKEKKDEKNNAEADLFDDWGVTSDDVRAGDNDDVIAPSVSEPQQQEVKPIGDEERLPDMDFDYLEIDESELDMQDIMDRVYLQTSDKKSSTSEPPPPRAFREIQVEFTDRGALPTKVARKSEDAKEAAASSISTSIAPAAEPSELSSPVLLEKAKAFMSRQDYASAFNAYTSLISTDVTLVQAYMNRAVCSLLQKDYPQAVSDCTSALTLCDAETDAMFDGQQAGEGEVDRDMTLEHGKRRAKILVRRGSALVWGGDLKVGLEDYKEAHGIVGGDDLMGDIRGIEERLLEMTEVM